MEKLINHKQIMQALLDGHKITCSGWDFEPKMFVMLDDFNLIDEAGSHVDFSVLDDVDFNENEYFFIIK